MDALIVLVLLGVAIVLMVTERLRADVVAMLTLAVLVLVRIVDAEAALSGFSNPATVTIAAMFVVSAGLQTSGVVGYLGDRLLLHGPSGSTALILLTGLVIAPISAFVNNTAVVAVFLPIMLRAAHGNGLSPSRFMMPLSFFAMLGGRCTLIGSTTNIVVSEMAREQGIAPFRMFEFSTLGLVLVAGCGAYLVLVGRHLVPDRLPASDATQGFDVGRYLSELVVLEGSPLVGKPLSEARLGERHDMEVLAHTRDGVTRAVPDGYSAFRAGDLLLVRAQAGALVKLEASTGLAVKPGRHPDVAALRASEAILVEAVITPNSDLVGQTLKSADFRNRFGATAIAIRRHGADLRVRIGKMALRVGDELLILAPHRNLERLRQQVSFVVLGSRDVPVLRKVHAAIACCITAGIVTVATLDLYPIATAAVAGAVLMVVTGCLPVRRVYQDIDWSVVFLLAGLIPLGIALETTGAARHAVDAMLGLTGGWGPLFVLASFFGMAALLTGFLSNNATAALLFPLALTTSQVLGVDPKPFLVAVMFASAAAFWTPIGYQTNLLVYGPGGYKFTDFVRCGGPLTILYWLLCVLLIPALFPFWP
jgi:di/tricarboxylate transporter